MSFKIGSKVAVQFPNSWRFGMVRLVGGSPHLECRATADSEGAVTPVYKMIRESDFGPSVVMISSIREIPVKVWRKDLRSERQAAKLKPPPPVSEGSDAEEEEIHLTDPAPARPMPTSILKRPTPPQQTAPPIPPAPVGDGKDRRELRATKVDDLGRQFNYLTGISSLKEDFWRGLASVPSEARITGAYLKEVVSRPRAVVSDVVERALVKSTRRQHVRYLQRVAEIIDEEESLPAAILRALETLKATHSWRASTTLKASAAVQGAMKVLPVYFQGALVVRLSSDPVWSLAMRTRGIEAREETPNQPQAISAEQLYEVVEKVSHPARAMALLLGWLTAARLGCIRKLQKGDVVLKKNVLSVTFRHGKGVRAKGPYTVHTQPIPPTLLKIWKEYFDSRISNLFGSSVTDESLRQALKKAGSKLEQRSIRRGALQLMAANGTSEETLMRFSGHARVETLRRYLNWNAINKKVEIEMLEAGKVLTQAASKRRRPCRPRA